MSSKHEPQHGAIVRLIRAAAVSQGYTAADLARMGNIPYSRAWELLNGAGNRRLANAEKALAALAPKVLSQIEAATDRLTTTSEKKGAAGDP